jgi:hypothetical protein
MRRLENMAYVWEKRNAYNILVEKSEGRDHIKTYA